MSLRLASLIGKLALSLYMGKFFPLAELGIYGLAFGAVMLAIVLFGFRVDYVISRDIFTLSHRERQRVGSGVAALYLGSFLLAAPLALGALFAFGGSGDVTLVLLIYLLCGVEAYANFLYTITIALKRPALANLLFFIRSGAWTIPAMVMSYFEPSWRTAEFVLGWWLAGAIASVLLNMWTMRAQLSAGPGLPEINWTKLRDYCTGAFLVWVGSVAVTLGAYVDRFILASFLTLDDVGVATFYISFTTAALTLVQSATTSISFPVMIEHFDAGRSSAFRRELRRTAISALVLALMILGGLALVMPLLASLLGKAELAAAYPAFVLLLVACLIRTHAETLYYALFVERQHRAIWQSSLLFFAVSMAMNFMLVPIAGLVGLGISAVVSALVILASRLASMQKARSSKVPQSSTDPAVALRSASEGEGV